MKKARFTESQIVAAIKKQKSGISVRDVCRELKASAMPVFTTRKLHTGA